MFNPFFINYYKKALRGFFYAVQPTDTLETISAAYKVPVNNLITINNLVYPYKLNTGERIFIPGVEEPEAKGKGSVYTVKPGDTITSIARKFIVSEEKLMAKNYINNRDSIYFGQKLLIPSEQKNDTIKYSNVQDTQSRDQIDEIKIYPINSVPASSMGFDYQKNNSIDIPGKKFPELKRGSKGKDVVTLQKLISALGFDTRRNTGIFGTELENQVKTIQMNAGFEANGIVDQKVWQFIFNTINKNPR